jgi:hypothetical protein
MRNITVSVDDATYRRARIRAAELDTSVSALVREFLGRLTGHAMGQAQEPHEQYVQGLDELFTDWDAHGIGLRGFDRLTREEVHDRERARMEMRRWVAEQQREALATELADLKTSDAEAKARA